MNLDQLHPREQIARIMQRVYRFGMTTTSGGNISIRDRDGSIWITPGGVDKGVIGASEIVHVTPHGIAEGLHKPSSELPFHLEIYNRRPDVCAVLHGHPAALVAFSIVRQVPDTATIPQARFVCGKVGYAPYALPGSAELGHSVAAIFAGGANSVIMENHGTVVAGNTLSQAFQRFETLEFCARTILEATSIGTPRTLTEAELRVFEAKVAALAELDHYSPSSVEKETRSHLRDMVRRAYRQRLITSTYGTFSARVEDGFLITPFGIDRYYVEREDFVFVRNGKRQPGRTASRSVRVHQKLYDEHPQIGSIISAQTPAATAFAVVGRTLETRTIPESYVMLGDIPVVPFGDQFSGGDKISAKLSSGSPVLLLANDTILVTGAGLTETFDRLEVCEFSAHSLIQSHRIGEVIPMSGEEIDALNREMELRAREGS